jgi:GTP:adenosylcobinamide-phosphate guanylyltransferase
MTVDAVVLAGRRDAAPDPLAAAAGVSHKCLVPVAGAPMLQHVRATLAAAPDIGRIAVSVDANAAVDAIIAPWRERIVRVQPEHNIVDSVLAAAVVLPPPLLITTADNVLLTPSGVAEIVRGSTGAGASAAFATRASVLSAHPDGQRRFYAFRDDSYSNCNAYMIADTRALAAAEVFRGGGQFAKHPDRIVKAFGLWNLVSFRLGLRTLAGSLAAFGRRFGFEIRAVVLSDGAQAIDVDNARTKTVAETILAARAVKATA